MPAIQQSPAKPYPSFEQIVGRHQGRVYSIALRITGDTGTAEEVAQDVFLECHRSLHSMASEEHLAAWLCRVACHRATDALRRRKSRGGDLVMTLEEDLLTPSKPQREDPLLNRVEQLLLTLPEQQRAVVLLRYQEDLEPQQIAETLGMPLATVRSHLQRGLKLLREKAERTLKEYTRG
ncbi:MULTISPECIES: sigma-70 family RNA polymerase sigma factor [Acidobacterium]|uniref:RNA polymerase sigma-70 factor, ECF family n=1 Tax=Acidobacterium capsulatum (strain ATCC 51196 / DSM 11244 / BCRC 80197 / JCM 7670 / NBRC 15755 / NCIMB 13165 / 161) TaxID=240015 RepID=C1F198_ACIC5|nr:MULTISPECIES: sigma-70 family RNA polymerase sigma factor [Acidobacterium]ACO32446.1 RNA polymerase sigma-70 factor, ECF family [Acidobacterium capsulatum ATCC 51196]